MGYKKKASTVNKQRRNFVDIKTCSGLEDTLGITLSEYGLSDVGAYTYVTENPVATTNTEVLGDEDITVAVIGDWDISNAKEALLGFEKNMNTIRDKIEPQHVLVIIQDGSMTWKETTDGGKKTLSCTPSANFLVLAYAMHLGYQTQVVSKTGYLEQPNIYLPAGSKHFSFYTTEQLGGFAWIEPDDEGRNIRPMGATAVTWKRMWFQRLRNATQSVGVIVLGGGEKAFQELIFYSKKFSPNDATILAVDINLYARDCDSPNFFLNYRKFFWHPQKLGVDKFIIPVQHLHADATVKVTECTKLTVLDLKKNPAAPREELPPYPRASDRIGVIRTSDKTLDRELLAHFGLVDTTVGTISNVRREISANTSQQTPVKAIAVIGTWDFSNLEKAFNGFNNAMKDFAGTTEKSEVLVIIGDDSLMVDKYSNTPSPNSLILSYAIILGYQTLVVSEERGFNWNPPDARGTTRNAYPDMTPLKGTEETSTKLNEIGTKGVLVLGGGDIAFQELIFYSRKFPELTVTAVDINLYARQTDSPSSFVAARLENLQQLSWNQFIIPVKHLPADTMVLVADCTKLVLFQISGSLFQTVRL